MSATVRCECCEGTGRRPLLGAERVTFDAVPTTWTPTGAIALLLPRVKRSALCNRLANLVRVGAIEGRTSEDNARIREFRRPE